MNIKKIILIIILLFVFMPNSYAYYETSVDITTMDVYEIQESIDKGYLTYEGLIRLYLDRIEAYDDQFNAIISINENAIEEAKECDKEYKENGRSNILYCMPIIVKDNIDVEGMATTAGAKSLSDSIPSSDSYVVSKLKEKGMIILAKANMSEFAFLASSSVSSYGTTKNAYNTNYSSYGSSGGSAVAVSLSYAPFALGTDTNSSLRAPSSANGVIGFRSTFGLIDTTGIVAYDITRDVVGPITKTVKENALLMETLTDEEGVYTDFNDATLEGKNIVVLDQFAYGDESGIYGTGETYSEIVTLFDNVLNKMEEAGANIIHLEDFYNQKYYQVEQKTLAGWTMCYAFNSYIKNTSSKINSLSELSKSKGHIYSLTEYVNDCSININKIDTYDEIKKSYKDFVENLIEEYDIDAFVYPTTKTKVTKVGSTNFESSSYTISPVLGMPSVSMPLGYDKDGLAYGIEFVSSKNSEQDLYKLIYAFEEINNVYKLSSLAPNLYEIPESVIKLQELYEDNNNIVLISLFNKDEINNYKDNLNKVKDFFLNYNDYDNKDEMASTLYEEYKLSLENLDSNNIINVIYILIIFLVLFVLNKLFLKKKKKRKRKK